MKARIQAIEPIWLDEAHTRSASVLRLTGAEIPDPVVDVAWLLKHDPHIGGWFTVDEDGTTGYQSA